MFNIGAYNHSAPDIVSAIAFQNQLTPDLEPSTNLQNISLLKFAPRATLSALNLPTLLLHMHGSAYSTEQDKYMKDSGGSAGSHADRYALIPDIDRIGHTVFHTGIDKQVPALRQGEHECHAHGRIVGLTLVREGAFAFFIERIFEEALVDESQA